VRVALHPPLEGWLQPGATLAGTLDFRFSQEAAAAGGGRCAAVAVMLETEECVLAAHRPGSSAIRKVAAASLGHALLARPSLRWTVRRSLGLLLQRPWRAAIV
jgi:hypothetical protein